MLSTLPLNRQVARFTTLLFVRLLMVTLSLWYSYQLRLIQQVTTPTGATIERIMTAGHSEDVFYDAGSAWGHGQGKLFAPTIKQQGTHYRWWLMLG